MPKISIITICYNEPNLEKTCESIVNQTWQDFEWIVVDGGSNKETLDIFEKYKNRIDKFVSEPDDGIYNACNKGIKMSEGEYLIFMNAGDWFYDKDILRLSNYFMENNKADIYYGNGEFSLNQNKKTEDFVSNYPPNLTREFFIMTSLCSQATFILKDLFDKYGLYNEEYKVVSDYEKWIQFFINDVKYKRLPLIVATFDLNGISSNQKTRALHLSERESVLNKYFSKEEILAAERKMQNIQIKQKYSFFEMLFSVKNSIDSTRKIITVLGVHFKIKRKK